MHARSLFVFLGAIALSQGALANGRFPRSQRVIEDPNDPRHLVLGATYGMLVTTDGGANWYLLCESSFAGRTLSTYDCAFDRVGSGELLVSFGDALSRAAPPFCDFSPTLGADVPTRVVDFSVVPSEPANVLAIVTRREDGGPGVSILARSSDGGETFTEFGTPLPDVENFATTIDSAPSNPDRVYVSGLDADRNGVLLVSDDGGEHFERRAIPGVTIDGPPFIAAVHPAMPDTVFVRTDGFEQDQFGLRTANDALYVTRDAGRTFQEVLRGQAKLYGFALSPAGDRVLAGFGDPRDVTVDPEALGIHAATVDEEALGPFNHETTEAVSCLKWTAQGLYVCATDFEVGFHLGFRADADLAGGLASFTPLLKLPDLRGPLACPDETTGARCAEDWPDTCQAVGAACELPPDGAGGAGATSAGEGGIGGDPGGASATGGTAPVPGARSPQGCACRTTATSRDAMFAEFGAALVFVALTITRRRGSR